MVGIRGGELFHYCAISLLVALETNCQYIAWFFFLSMQCDIENPQVDQSVLDEFCKKHNIAGWYELCM